MQKSILITGCSSGIGYYCAKELSKAGWKVYATARKHQDVTRLNNEGLTSYQLDLDDSESIKSAVDKILADTGGTLDALFNNAAFGQPGAVEDLTRDVMRESFETNVFGTMELCNLIVPVMRKQGYGRIIQNSSVLGFVCMPYRGCYNASKYALEGFSDTLRLELSDTNIKVSIIEPGPIVSKFRENAHKKFIHNIDLDNSAHSKVYKSVAARLDSINRSTKFTKGPEAVHKALMHALESKQPKIRYWVTTPTKMFGFLTRVLPARIIDKMLAKYI